MVENYSHNNRIRSPWLTGVEIPRMDSFRHALVLSAVDPKTIFRISGRSMKDAQRGPCERLGL